MRGIGRAVSGKRASAVDAPQAHTVVWSAGQSVQWDPGWTAEREADVVLPGSDGQPDDGTGVGHADSAPSEPVMPDDDTVLAGASSAQECPATSTDGDTAPKPLRGVMFQGLDWQQAAEEWHGQVQWLSPADFDVDNTRATANFLHTMGQEVFGDVGHQRGVDVEASFYPLVRPRENLSADTVCNDKVPETWAALRLEPMPVQCRPATTERIPLPARRVWDQARPFPFPPEMCRAPREGENGTPFERVVAWSDSYHKEWLKVLRGRQKGKAAYRFNYNNLSEGGRNGLIIDDYFTEDFRGFQWDHRPYWASGGALPCIPLADMPAQRWTDWRLRELGVEAGVIEHPDLNLIYELTEIGFRTFSTVLDDNKVCLFPNRKGFFEHPEFVAEKSEEERVGFVVPKLHGSCPYPSFLCCRLHPRNVAVQKIISALPPVDVVPRRGRKRGREDIAGEDDEAARPTTKLKLRQTTDCGADGKPWRSSVRRRDGQTATAPDLFGDSGTSRAGRGRRGQHDDAGPAGQPTKSAACHSQPPRVQHDDRMSFNEAIPMEDGRFHPPLRYSSVSEFAKGLGVLKAADIKVGAMKMDLRAYYRFLVNNSREVHAAIQWVDAKVRCEVDHVCQFGLRSNCSAATRTSTLLAEIIRARLYEEQARWRTDGRLDALPAEVKAKLRAWEVERSASEYDWLQQLRAAWKSAELTPEQCKANMAELLELAETSNRRCPYLYEFTQAWAAAACSDTELQELEAAWWKESRRVCTPWWTDGVFIDDFFAGAFAFFLPALVRVYNEVFAEFNVTTADGRVDPVTGAITKNKFEESYTELEILGIVLEYASKHGSRKLTEGRAATYAAAARALVGRPTVPLSEFESILGRIVFAAQALPKLRGLIAGLLGVQQQHWSAHEFVRLGRASWAVLATAAEVLIENEGMVLFPMRQRQGGAGRPVIWVFTDSARDPDADHTKYVGFGGWVWLEGSDTIFMNNGRWLPKEQDLDITALEYHAAGITLELAQMVRVALLGEEVVATGCDVIMVGDNMGATMVARSVRASSPALRVLVQQRLERMATRPCDRLLPVHSFREDSTEADDLSKNELAVLAAKFSQRFNRPMKLVLLPPAAPEWRSLEAAQSALRGWNPAK